MTRSFGNIYNLLFTNLKAKQRKKSKISVGHVVFLILVLIKLGWYSSIHEDSLLIDDIFKLLRSPGIASKESVPPAFVAWSAGTTTLFLLGAYLP